MPIIRMNDIRPNDIVNPSTMRISLGICCNIQTMGFHGFVDEETDPEYTIMKVDDGWTTELAPNDVKPEVIEMLRAMKRHCTQSRRCVSPMRTAEDFAAMAQVPIEPEYGSMHHLHPIYAGSGYRLVHPERGSEFIADGRPLAEIRMNTPGDTDDSLSWEDVTLMTNGG